MVRKSNYTPAELLEAIGRAVQAFQDATDEMDEAVARLLGINRTDLRCLSALARLGGASPSELADAVGLTRAAMTTVLDRLENAGYARRSPHPEDRRGLRVEFTEEAARRSMQYYGAIAREGSRKLARYSTAELEAVLRYLEMGTDLQRDQARRLRGPGRARKPRTPK